MRGPDNAQKQKLVAVRLDDCAQVLEFFTTFQASNVSNYFSFVCLPPGNPSDPETRGIRVFLAPMGETDCIDRQFLDILKASLHDGMLVKWQSEGRITIPSETSPAEAMEHMVGPSGFEPKLFRIDSTEWKEGFYETGARGLQATKVKINALRDAIEMLDGSFKGHQFFSQAAALRETAKAGKRMPTMADWYALIRKLEPDVELCAGWQNQAYLVRRLALFWEAQEADPWLTIHSSDSSPENGDAHGISLTAVRVQPCSKFYHDTMGLVFCHKE